MDAAKRSFLAQTAVFICVIKTTNTEEAFSELATKKRPKH